MHLHLRLIRSLIVGWLLVSSAVAASFQLRLHEIWVTRYTRDDSGQAWLSYGLFNAEGKFRSVESTPLTLPESFPAAALNKPLSSFDEWSTYHALGLQALANFVRGNNGVPLSIFQTPHYVVEVSPEANPATGPVVNLSTRGKVDAGDDAGLIAGFVIEDRPRAVLLRGIGPALGAFGVGAPLPDPVLTVRRGGTVVASNDSWSESTQAGSVAHQAARLGAFSLTSGSRDAALLITLEPGAYTASVTAAAGTGGGTGLVEIYVIP